MMSRREDLLVKPWIRRRYQDHRKKVEAALPAVDAGPPAFRPHVCRKMKKLQMEEERLAQIAEDNLRLLERTSAIMKAKGMVDHHLGPVPSFLRRVGIYLPREPSAKDEPLKTAIHTNDEEIQKMIAAATSRKGRCSACVRKGQEKSKSNTCPPTPFMLKQPRKKAQDKPSMKKRHKISLPNISTSQKL